VVDGGSSSLILSFSGPRCGHTNGLSHDERRAIRRRRKLAVWRSRAVVLGLLGLEDEDQLPAGSRAWSFSQGTCEPLAGAGAAVDGRRPRRPTCARLALESAGLGAVGARAPDGRRPCRCRRRSAVLATITISGRGGPAPGRALCCRRRPGLSSRPRSVVKLLICPCDLDLAGEVGLDLELAFPSSESSLPVMTEPRSVNAIGRTVCQDHSRPRDVEKRFFRSRFS